MKKGEVNTRKLIIYCGLILVSITTVLAIVATTAPYKASDEVGTLPGVAVCSDDLQFKSKYEIQVTNGQNAGVDSLRSISLPNYQTYHQVNFRDYLDPKLDVFLSGKTSLTQSDYQELATLINVTYNEWVSLSPVRDLFYNGVEKPPVFASADVVNRFNYTPNVPEKKYIGFNNPLKFNSAATSFEISPRSINWQRLKEGGHLSAINWDAKAEFRTGNKNQKAWFDCLQLYGAFNGSAKLQYLEARFRLRAGSYNVSFFVGYNPSSERGYGNNFPRN